MRGSLTAESIKQALSMRDVVAFYASAPEGGKAMMRCPFHDDKTASFKLYKDGYKCFGCGAHGDPIDFVRQLYGVDFWAAARQIDHDFGLGLALDAPPDDRTRSRADELAERRAARRKALYEAEVRYWHALDRWHLFDRLLRDATPYSTLWGWAAKRVHYAQFALEDAQTEWIEVRKRHV